MSPWRSGPGEELAYSAWPAPSKLGSPWSLEGKGELRRKYFAGGKLPQPRAFAQPQPFCSRARIRSKKRPDVSFAGDREPYYGPLSTTMQQKGIGVTEALAPESGDT